MRPHGAVQIQRRVLRIAAVGIQCYIGQACVLLAEQQADGSFHVREVIRNQSVLNAGYAALYAKQKTSIVKAEADVAAANDADGAIHLQA